MYYEINEETLAIIQIDEKKTRVLEVDNEYIVNQSTYEIMDNSCQYFGSTYEGRKIGSSNLLGNGYKIPILIKEKNYLIFFPTESPLLKSCIWISLHNIEKYEKNIDTRYTNIYFKNGKKIKLDVSFRSIEHQIYRSTRLESILRDRNI